MLTVRDDGFKTLLAHRIAPETDWGDLFGSELLHSAHRAPGPVAAAIAAGRWGDKVAYGIVTRIEDPDRGLLCALRHDRPFDAIEVAGAAAAAALLVGSPGEAPDAQPRQLRERTTDGRLRILAVEDHPLMREGIRAVLDRAGLLVVGTPATCAEAVELVRAGGLDAVLLDLHLPDADGVEAIVRLRAVAPALPIVAFTVESAPERVREALRAGATGYLPKSIAGDQLVAALRAAAAGLAALLPEQAAGLLERSETPLPPSGPADGGIAESPPADTPLGVARPSGSRTRDALTARELELLRYLAEGYTNKEMARAMALAEDTVKKAVQMLIAKLRATDRTHAVVLALRASLIE